MLLRFDEKLRQPRVGAAVHHIFHIHIAQKVAIVHPRRPHRQHLHLRFGKPQRAAVETHQRRLADAASAREDHEARRLHGNMEMQQILFVIEKAVSLCGFGEAGKEIRFTKWLLRRLRSRRRDFGFHLRRFLLFYMDGRRISIGANQRLCHEIRRLLVLAVQPFERISRDPASAEQLAVSRHRAKLAAKIRQIFPRHEPQGALLAANDVGEKLGIPAVHQRKSQKRVLGDGAEIRAALAHYAGVKGIAPHGRKDHPGADFIFKIFRGRDHQRARPLIIPIALRHAGDRLILQEVAAKLIDVPAKDRRLQRAKGRDGIIVAILVHERRPPLLHHVV